MIEGGDTSWGVIATAKAPMRDVLGFCAHHLDLGAERLYIYLDAPDPETKDHLRRHPKIKVVQTDNAWWAKRRGRPDKHQARQFLNARHACNRRAEVHWLTHIDVDEYLWPDRPVAELLDALPVDCLCARVRPVEALAPDPAQPRTDTCFKGFHLDRKAREAAAARIFPTYGRHLSGGFLSHVAGKLFFRAGIGMKVKIHNVYLDGDENPGMVEMPEIRLCHMHAESWDDWRARFDYRMEMGSYRAELQAPVNRAHGGLSLHELFKTILADEGEAGLRAFYDEVCVATPGLLARLDAEGLLHRTDLALDARIARHFPKAA